MSPYILILENACRIVFFEDSQKIFETWIQYFDPGRAEGV